MKTVSDKQINTVSRPEKPFPQRGLKYQLATTTLANEVLNPLSNINLAVGMLRSLPNTEHLKIYLDIINRASYQIEVLMKDLIKPYCLSSNQDMKR